MLTCLWNFFPGLKKWRAFSDRCTVRWENTANTNFVGIFLQLFSVFGSPIAVGYAVHWHSLQLIAISYSALWCWPDLKILFVNRPYLWSVCCLAGLKDDKPSNSHLPLKRATGGVKFPVFKGILSFPSNRWDHKCILHGEGKNETIYCSKSVLKDEIIEYCST